MKLISRNLAAVCLMLPLVGLTGCAAVGGGADGAVVNDLLSERAVHRALFSESSLSDNSILVGCVNGVITLTGQVDDDVERQLAERLASGVTGVTAVNNNLKTRS